MLKVFGFININLIFDQINIFFFSGSSSLSPSAMLPPIDPVSQSFILDKGLPPIFMVNKGEATYEENWSLSKILEKLKDPNLPPLQFAINRNLVASIKIVKC